MKGKGEEECEGEERGGVTEPSCKEKKKKSRRQRVPFCFINGVSITLVFYLLLAKYFKFCYVIKSSLAVFLFLEILTDS